MKIIVDRIEGDYLVAELPDGGFADFPRTFAPDAGEGDIIIIEVKKEEAKERSARMKSRLNNLFEGQEE